jgi:hypothetical protein
MGFLDRLTGFFRKGEGIGAKSDLQKNMEKALHMKQAAAPQAQTPPHETAHEGMKPTQGAPTNDATPPADAAFTPQLKQSRVARSGDT